MQLPGKGAPGPRSGPGSRTPSARLRHLLNRELSWIDFDRRVLELAADPGVPLLDRAKFCAIASSNLDEFFGVRMAELEENAAARTARTRPGRTHGGADSRGCASRDRRAPGDAGPALARRAPTRARSRPDPDLLARRVPAARAPVAGEARRARSAPAPHADRRRTGRAVPARSVAQPQHRRDGGRRGRHSASCASACRRTCRASSRSAPAACASRSRTRSCN